MKELQQYTYTIPAGGSVQIPAANDNFIIQASTGPVAVRGNTFGRLRGVVAGMGLKMVPFDRLELFDESGAPNTVTLLMTPAEFVNQTFSGSVAVVSGVLTDTQLRASDVGVRVRPEAGSIGWRSLATLGANAPDGVFSAAANVNGAIIWSAESCDSVAANPVQSFVAKATAPANVFDGEIVALATARGQAAGGSNWVVVSQLMNPVRIAAGLGLYFISTNAGTAGMGRQCRYTLL